DRKKWRPRSPNACVPTGDGQNDDGRRYRFSGTVLWMGLQRSVPLADGACNVNVAPAVHVGVRARFKQSRGSLLSEMRLRERLIVTRAGSALSAVSLHRGDAEVSKVVVRASMRKIRQYPKMDLTVTRCHADRSRWQLNGPTGKARSTSQQQRLLD